jgi:hypothetical protein
MSKTRRYRITGILLVVLLAAASPALAQAEFGFDVRGGLAAPVGNFNEAFDLGFGVQSSLYIEFSPVAAAGIGVGYNRFPFDASSGVSAYEYDGGEMSFLSICPELRFMVGTGDMATFAFVVGAGLYRISQADVDITDPNDSSNNATFSFDAVNKMGVNTAGKVAFPLSDNVKIGVEAMWHLVFTEQTVAPPGGTPFTSGADNASFFDFMAVLVITTGT